jgi:hypothetical protein
VGKLWGSDNITSAAGQARTDGPWSWENCACYPGETRWSRWQSGSSARGSFCECGVVVSVGGIGQRVRDRGLSGFDGASQGVAPIVVEEGTIGAGWGEAASRLCLRMGTEQVGNAGGRQEPLLGERDRADRTRFLTEQGGLDAQ